MANFLNDLYDYISEDVSSLRGNPQYARAVKAYMEIEAEVKKKTGVELLERYQQAESQVSSLRNLEILRRSLRFGARFAAEVLG